METGRVTPSRVTRSQHKHLQSENDNSSRPGTPVSTHSSDISPKDTGLRRTTRRLSTSTPSKLTGKSVKEGTPEVSTPSKRITRRNSTSIIEVEVQKSGKTPKFPTLAEEDVNSEKPKYEEKTRRKSISPKLRSQSDNKISATTSRFTRSALKIEVESKIKTKIPKKKESPLKKKIYSNDCEDSEVEVINISDEDSNQSSVITVKEDKNAKKTIKGKKQKTVEVKEGTKKLDVVENNEKDTVKSTDEEKTKDIKTSDSIAIDKNSIKIEEEVIEQPVENKMSSEDIDLTDDNENSFKADENKSKENSNEVIHNKSIKAEINVKHNESDVEMMEIDEEVVGIDIKKNKADEGENIRNDDKDIETIKENVCEHKKDETKINDTSISNNEVIIATNTKQKTHTDIINSYENMDPNTENNKNKPSELNKSLNELNVNKSYKDDVEIISNNLVIKDVFMDEIVGDSKVSNADLNENNSILEASSITVPDTVLKKNNSLLEASNIQVPNSDLKKDNIILEASNIEVPNTDLQKHNSILEASNIAALEEDIEQNNSTSNENDCEKDCENDLNMHNVSLKLNDMKKSFNSSKSNSPCTLPIEETSKPSTPVNIMRKLKVMVTSITSDPKIKETLLDKTLNSNKKNEEPTTPNLKIKETLLDKTLNSNKKDEEPTTPNLKIKETLLDKTSNSNKKKNEPTTPHLQIKEILLGKTLNSNKKNEEPTTPDLKMKETLLDKTLISNKKDEEPTTPDLKIKKTLLDKTLNSNKKNEEEPTTPDKADKSLPSNTRTNGQRNSVTFDNSDDDDVEKKTYPKTPSLLKSKSYIEVDSSKSDLEEKKQESNEQLPLLEVTPLKYKILKKLKSSTPIINSANKVIKTKDELKQIDLEMEKSITLNSTSEKSCANSINELVKEKSSPKKTTALNTSIENKDDSSKSINNFAQSWTQCVSVKVGNNSKIDTIAESKTLGIHEDVEIKNLSKQKNSSQLHLQLESDEESNEQSNEESNEQSNEESDEEHTRNKFIDDEAMDAGEDYCSGDSMDEEERREIEENDIIPDGESIGSCDTDEGDVSEEDDEKLSFIATSSEDEIQNIDEDYSNGSNDSNDSDGYVVLHISDEEDDDNVDEIKQASKNKRKHIIESTSETESETQHKVSNSTTNKRDVKNMTVERNTFNSSTKSSNSSDLSESALKLRVEPKTDRNLDKSAVKELNESRKKILKDMNRSDRFNKSFFDNEAPLESSSDVTDDVNKSSSLSDVQNEGQVLKKKEIKKNQTETDVNESEEIIIDSVSVQKSPLESNDHYTSSYENKESDGKNAKLSEINLNESLKSTQKSDQKGLVGEVVSNNHIEIQINRSQESMEVDEDYMLSTNDEADNINNSQIKSNSHKKRNETVENNLTDNSEIRKKDRLKRKSLNKSENDFENNQSLNGNDKKISKNKSLTHEKQKEKIFSVVENAQEYLIETVSKSPSKKKCKKNNDNVFSSSYDEQVQGKLNNSQKSVSSKEIRKNYDNSSSSDAEVTEKNSEKRSKKRMKKRKDFTSSCDDEAKYKSQSLSESLSKKEKNTNYKGEYKSQLLQNLVSDEDENFNSQLEGVSSDEREAEHKSRSVRKSNSKDEKDREFSDEEYKLQSLEKSYSKNKKSKKNPVFSDEEEIKPKSESIRKSTSNKENSDKEDHILTDDKKERKSRSVRKSLPNKEKYNVFEEARANSNVVETINISEMFRKSIPSTEDVVLDINDEEKIINISRSSRISLPDKEKRTKDKEYQSQSPRKSFSNKENDNKDGTYGVCRDESEDKHESRKLRKSSCNKEKTDETDVKEIEYKSQSFHKSVYNEAQNNISEDDPKFSSEDEVEHEVGSKSSEEVEPEHKVDFKSSDEEELELEEDVENSDEEELEHEEDFKDSDEEEAKHKSRSFRKSISNKEKKSKIEKGRSFIDDDEENRVSSDEEQIEYKSQSLRKSVSKNKVDHVSIDDDKTEHYSQLQKNLKSKKAKKSKNEKDHISSDMEEKQLKSISQQYSISVEENKKNNKSISSYNADVEDGYKSCLSRKSLSGKKKKITDYISSNFGKETKCKPESPQKLVSRKEIKRNVENIPSSSDYAEVNNEMIEEHESSDSSINERKDVDVKKHSLYYKENEEKIENEAETISSSKKKSLLYKKTKIDVGKDNSCDMENLNHSKRKSLSFEGSKLKSTEKNRSLRHSLLKGQENVETKESILQTHSDSDFVEIQNMSDNESSTEEQNECDLFKNLPYKNVIQLDEQEETDSSDEDKTEINNKSVNKSTKKKYSLNKHKEIPTSSSEPEKNEADVVNQSQTLNNKHSLNSNFKIQSTTLSNSKKRKFTRDLDATSSSDEDEIKVKTTAKVSSRLCTSFIGFNKKANEKYYEKLHTSCTLNTFEVGNSRHQINESGYEKVEENANQILQAAEPNSDEFHSAEENIFTDFEQIDEIHVDNRRQSLAPTGHRIPGQFLNASQSFIENISEDNKQTRKDKHIKRKRLTQSFCSAGSLDTTDLELRHVNKKRKILEQNDSEVDKSLKDLTAKNLEEVLEKNKNEVSQEQYTSSEVPKKAAADDVSSPVDSKNDFKLKEKTKLAMEQALKASADIITQMARKKKKNKKKLVDGNKFESKQKHVSEENISKAQLETVSNSEDQAQSSNEIHKLKSAAGEITETVSKSKPEAAQSTTEVNKIKSSAGDIIETPITPKKKIHVTRFNLPTGTVCVEPMTPCSKAVVNGFQESPITPTCIGFKVQSNYQVMSPTTSRKSRKRKRYIEEPKHSLPKPKWTQSGQFIEEEMSKGEIVNLKKGKKIDSLQLSKESALNFKNRALFRKNIQRESSQTLLRRKERGFQNKF